MNWNIAEVEANQPCKADVLLPQELLQAKHLQL